MSWEKRAAKKDGKSIFGKASQREVALVEDYTVYNKLRDLDYDFIQEREHYKRRRVLSRWQWASETAGHDDAAKAAALMKGLYAEDHTQALYVVEKQLEAHREVSTSIEAALREGIDVNLERIAQTTKEGLADIANELHAIHPSEGKADMDGVESCLNALNATLEKVQK